MVYILILGAIRTIFVFWDHDEKTMVRTFCDDLINFTENEPDLSSSKRGWDATNFTSMEDCKSQVGYSIMRDELLALCFGFAFQAHFALVLFTHYKNAQLAKSRGGCQPDNNI